MAKPWEEPGQYGDICIPMKVEAFMVNDNCPPIPLAPLIKPDYHRLGFQQALLEGDIIPHIPTPSINQPQTRKSGIYLHWTLPRHYRHATSDTKTPPHSKFPVIPDRWFVLRWTHEPQRYNTSEFHAFVIQSDSIRTLGEFDPNGDDLELETSPFLNPDHLARANSPEILLGYKRSFDPCKPSNVETPPIARPSVEKMTVQSGSNHLFADYVPHNLNVFSLYDPLEYYHRDETGQYFVQQLEEIKVDYMVLGWHTKYENDPLQALLKPDPTTNLKELKQRLSSLNLVWTGEDIELTRKRHLESLLIGGIYHIAWSKWTSISSSEALSNTQISVGIHGIDAVQSFFESSSEWVSAIKASKLNLSSAFAKIHLLPPQDSSLVEEIESKTHEQSFIKRPGGTKWHFVGKLPVDDHGNCTECTRLEKLNEAQQFLEKVLSEIVECKTVLSGLWWNCLAGGTNEDVSAKMKQVEALKMQLTELETLQRRADHERKVLQKTLLTAIASSSAEPFFEAKDPSVVITGLKSGWPDDWDSPFPVRGLSNLGNKKLTQDIQQQIVGPINIPSLKGKRCMPSNRLKRIDFFVSDWIISRPLEGSTEPPPYYGPERPLDNPRWTVWKGQPFCPLFVEWEVDYHHIPFECWESVLSPGGLCYRLKESVAGKGNDVRVLSGRSLIHHQLPTTLRSNLQHFLEHEPTEKHSLAPIDTYLKELSILNFRLSGFIHHLVTLLHGIHLKPASAVDHLELTHPEIGLDKEIIQKLESIGSIVPYGSLVDVSDNYVPGRRDPKPSTYSPFKPVTHGQFRFAKLNIVDKFGQVLSPLAAAGNLSLRTSQALSCGVVMHGSEARANSVDPAPLEKNPFLQLPPRINQPARLNASFVVQDKAKRWRMAQEEENPVWGWIIANVAISTIQIFFPDGTFHNEILVDTKASNSHTWTPFEHTKKPVNDLLSSFVDKLQSPGYLLGVFKLLSGAIQCSLPYPDAFCATDAVVIGRPFALVCAGLSLETSEAARVNLSDNDNRPPTMQLTDYEFPLKLGDPNLTYDGLVGYFKSPSDFDCIRTHFPMVHSDTAEPTAIKLIKHAALPRLRTTYISVLNENSPEKYAIARDQKLSIFSFILNPFLPVHANVGVLPTKSLQLNASSALNKISAFFKLGPTILPTAFPTSFDSGYSINGDDLVESKIRPTPGASHVPFPGIGTGSKEHWQFLQPYKQDEKVVYNAFAVESGRSGNSEEGVPYTAVEGYLHGVHAKEDKGDPPFYSSSLNVDATIP
jgi:hypothetical protein